MSPLHVVFSSEGPIMKFWLNITRSDCLKKKKHIHWWIVHNMINYIHLENRYIEIECDLWPYSIFWWCRVNLVPCWYSLPLTSRILWLAYFYALDQNNNKKFLIISVLKWLTQSMLFSSKFIWPGQWVFCIGGYFS